MEQVALNPEMVNGRYVAALPGGGTITSGGKPLTVIYNAHHENGGTTKRFTFLCVCADKIESLPEALRQMQESIATCPLTMPRPEEMKDFEEVNLFEIYVGETYPMECLLKVPLSILKP